MHRPAHGQRAGARRGPGSPTAAAPIKRRRNRKRRDWNQILRRICVVALAVEAWVALFANPHLVVTKVKVHGVRTLTEQQVFEEARVPARRNIFLMLKEPFDKRLTGTDPVIAQASRRIELPDTLVLTVAERRPYAALAVADGTGGQNYWLLDKTQVPFRSLPQPPGDVPVIQWAGDGPPAIRPGRPLADPRLAEAYGLLDLIADKKDLGVTQVTVDEKANLCLNSGHHLRILLGQPDALPRKVAIAEAAVAAREGDIARRADYIDVSCPEQPVWRPRPLGKNEAGDDGRAL